ncbi:NAD-dependent deacetylase, partial [gut metagenome]
RKDLDDEVIRNPLMLCARQIFCIVGGTSLAVYPAAGLLGYYQGRKLVVINKTPTPADAVATLVLNMSIGEALKKDDGE